MEAWLLARWAEFDAGDRTAGDAIDRVLQAEAPKYPDTKVTFDYSASFAERVSFRLGHEFGFGMAYVYCYVPTPKSSRWFSVHELDWQRGATAFGVEGYTPPSADTLKQDFAAFLQRPAPDGTIP